MKTIHMVIIFRQKVIRRSRTANPDCGGGQKDWRAPTLHEVRGLFPWLLCFPDQFIKEFAAFCCIPWVRGRDRGLHSQSWLESASLIMLLLQFLLLLFAFGWRFLFNMYIQLVNVGSLLLPYCQQRTRCSLYACSAISCGVSPLTQSVCPVSESLPKCVCLYKVHKSVFFMYMALEDWGPTSHNHDLFSDAPGVNSSSNLTQKKTTKESNLRGSVTN